MRKGVALLITLFFMILVAVAVGLGLGYANDARSEVEKESFLIQSSVIVADVIRMLKNSSDIEQIVDTNSSASFYAFLSTSSFIPLQSNGYRILISLRSARGKFNVNALMNSQREIDQKRLDALERFLTVHEIQNEFASMLLDAMGGIREDGVYYSDVFYNNPEMFRDFIASRNHFETILRYYKMKYHDNVDEKVDFLELFSFYKDRETTVDLNYATPLVWELILGCTPQRARQLSKNTGMYESVEDIGLDENEREKLERFATSFYEPIVLVDVVIEKGKLEAAIRFTYDLKKRKASDFSYEF